MPTPVPAVSPAPKTKIRRVKTKDGDFLIVGTGLYLWEEVGGLCWYEPWACVIVKLRCQDGFVRTDLTERNSLEEYLATMG